MEFLGKHYKQFYFNAYARLFSNFWYKSNLPPIHKHTSFKLYKTEYSLFKDTFALNNHYYTEILKQCSYSIAVLNKWDHPFQILEVAKWSSRIHSSSKFNYTSCNSFLSVSTFVDSNCLRGVHTYRSKILLQRAMIWEDYVA